MFSQFSRDFNKKCLTSVTGCCVCWRNELLGACSALSNTENQEKLVVFLGSATSDVEIRVMVISVALHLVQGKGVHLGKIFLEY